MRRTFLCILLFCSCFPGVFAPTLARGQGRQADSPASNVILRVNGEVEHSLQLNSAEVAKLPRHTARAIDHGGVEAAFEGTPLVEILRLAGAKLGEQLRGQEMTTYVLVKAADNYQVVFAVAELDSGFTDRVIFLADRRDGNPLSAKEGPLRIIVPGEKRHARWVRQVTSLTLIHAGAKSLTESKSPE